MSPTNCHELIVANQLPPTNCHQPIVINRLSATNSHQPVVTNQLSSTNCHQQIVTNQLPPTNCHVTKQLSPTNCQQQISTNQLSPTNCHQPIVFFRGSGAVLAGAGRCWWVSALLKGLYLRSCFFKTWSSTNCHQSIVTPTNCHPPNCHQPPTQTFSLAKLLTCGVIRSYNFSHGKLWLKDIGTIK